MRQPYPGYQSSHVEWLGDLPEHWEVRRLGAALAETVGGGTPDTGNESYWADDDEEGLRWVAIADMSAGGAVATTAKRVTSLGRAAARLRPLPAGTIIYSMYASVGAVARLSMSAATNQAILGLVPGEMLESSFLYWWLTGVRKPVLSLTRDNTQSNLNAETVRKIPLALPPLDEQRSISAFLDHETAKIDTLVAKNRLLLDRLAEYRTALITRTVTKGLPPAAAKQAGLNPNPPLKPSGVEWIGDIPEHWEVKQLRRIAHLHSGDGISSDEIHPEGYYPVIGANGVRGYTDRYAHEGEAVIIGRVGAECGSVYLAGGQFWASDNAVVTWPVGGESALWLYCLLDAMNLHRYSTTTAQPLLTAGQLSGLLIPIPPVKEQRAIASFLDRQTERIDTLHWRVEAAIERLQEYRTALITAAVTGKIDVRDHDAVEMGASRT